MTVGVLGSALRRTTESRAPTQPGDARIVLSRVPLFLVFGCMLAAPFWNAGAQPIPRPFDITFDVNPALSHATGFALADGAPALFRAFTPRGRHVMLLYPARMATSEGFVAAQYVYNSRNLAVNYVSGGSESWMISASGGGTTDWGRSSIDGGPPTNNDYASRFDTTDADTDHIVGASFDLDGFFGQIHFANNLTDVRQWQVALGLGL